MTRLSDCDPHYWSRLGAFTHSQLKATNHVITLLLYFSLLNALFCAACRAQSQLRTASVAKTFTAIVVLQLVEEGKLQLEGRIEDLLDDDFGAVQATVSELQVANGSSNGALITVRHLLAHTSGIPDYFVEKSRAGPRQNRSWLDIAFSAPDTSGEKNREVESRRTISSCWTAETTRHPCPTVAKVTMRRLEVNAVPVFAPR